MTHEYSPPRNVTLILLPGLDGCRKLFEPLLACLPDTLEKQVLCYPQDVSLSYEELTDFIRDSLPKDAPYLLMGHSFAGPLAIRLAAEKRGRLLGLILAVGFARCPHPWIPSVLRHLVDPLVFAAYPPLKWANRVFHWEKSRGVQHAVGAVVETVAPRVLADRIKSIATVDFRQDLKRLAVPILCLSGKYDILVPGWNSRSMQKAVQQFSPTHPEYVRRAFPMGHMVLRGRPAEAAAAIVEMLSACTSGASVDEVVTTGEPVMD